MLSIRNRFVALWSLSLERNLAYCNLSKNGMLHCVDGGLGKLAKIKGHLVVSILLELNCKGRSSSIDYSVLHEGFAHPVAGNIPVATKV